MRQRRIGWVWLLVVAIALIMVVALTVWLLRTLPEAVDPTWDRIQETGTLRVCTDPSWPPFEYINEDTGQIEGFDADLARLLASRLVTDGHLEGVQAEFVTVGFDGLYDALLSGRCDLVLSALPYEPMRTEDVAFSLAYFNAGLILVTREEVQAIEAVKDLEDRVVGVEWGFVLEGDSRQRLFFQDLGARRYATGEDVLRALQAGELEAALVDRISALTYLRDCQGLKIVGEPVADVNYVIPLRPDSFRLIEEVNRVLLETREEGVLEELQRRWF